MYNLINLLIVIILIKHYLFTLFSKFYFSFPNYFATSLLIFCGADVNATDNDKNTPLHCMDKFIKML